MTLNFSVFYKTNHTCSSSPPVYYLPILPCNIYPTSLFLFIKMFSRTRSIFHIEEEGEWDYNISKGEFAAETEGAVGLQIIIKHVAIDSRALFCSAMNKKKKKKKKKPVLQNLSADHFLKFCCACSKELSLQNEVYMYRGDQGFCSVECRYQQILEDERIMRTPNYQHERSKIQESSKIANIFVAA